MSLLSSLPVWLKAQLGPGWSGCDKLPIRLLTARCGAAAAAARTKRAIQFGSRIAKLESKTEKAADVCDRLTEARTGGGDPAGDAVGGGDGDEGGRTAAVEAVGAAVGGAAAGDASRGTAAASRVAIGSIGGCVRNRTAAAVLAGGEADCGARLGQLSVSEAGLS